MESQGCCHPPLRFHVSACPTARRACGHKPAIPLPPEIAGPRAGAAGVYRPISAPKVLTQTDTVGNPAPSAPPIPTPPPAAPNVSSCAAQRTQNPHTNRHRGEPRRPAHPQSPHHHPPPQREQLRRPAHPKPPHKPTPWGTPAPSAPPNPHTTTRRPNVSSCAAQRTQNPHANRHRGESRRPAHPQSPHHHPPPPTWGAAPPSAPATHVLGLNRRPAHPKSPRKPDTVGNPGAPSGPPTHTPPPAAPTLGAAPPSAPEITTQAETVEISAPGGPPVPTPPPAHST